MNFRKLIKKTHLVLGLASGLVVFIVAITGCLYVFKSEIENVTQRWKKIEVQDKGFIPPSELKTIARGIFPDNTLHGIAYGKADEVAEIVFYEEGPPFYRTIYANPYSGEIVKIKDLNKDFFRVVLMGHFQLWMPIEIGQPVIAVSVLVFVIMIITGIKLWWPRKRPPRESFKIRWKSPLRRKLFDFHSVLGFYGSFILLILSLTGLVWGFRWFAKVSYKATGGKKELAFKYPLSDSTKAGSVFDADKTADWLYHKMKSLYPAGAEIEVHFPEAGNHEALFAHVNPDHKTYWKTDFRYFDKYTFEEIEVDNIWGKLENADGADKLRRMNYDIHIGAIWGIPGKILIFLASLIAASLPVTGIWFWVKKTKEKRKFLKKMIDGDIQQK